MLDLATTLIRKIRDICSDRVFAQFTASDTASIIDAGKNAATAVFIPEADRDARLAAANITTAVIPSPDWRSSIVNIWTETRFVNGLEVVRPPVPGIAFLNQRVHGKIFLRNQQSFLRDFKKLSRQVLNNLDWSNVVAAGGFVLACLTAHPDNGQRLFRPTDLDLFFWDLDPEEAEEKLRHIHDTIKANVPDFEIVYDTVRNCGTVTFRPKVRTGKYPTVQVILRLASSPAEIIANFDLDVVAMGFDGEQVMMEPRAQRALETGLNVMTDKLVKSTSPYRLLKYASRGFGLVLRPTPASPEDIKILAKRATDGFDWIRNSLQASRRPGQDSLPPHRAVNLLKATRSAYVRTGGRWMQSYNAFVLLAGLWDTAVLFTPHQLGDLWRGRQNHYVMYQCPTSPTYRSDTEDDSVSSLEEAVCAAADVEEEPFLQVHDIDIVPQLCGSLDEVLQCKLRLLVILPVGFRASLHVQMSEFSTSGYLQPVEGAPMLGDIHGNRFEVCTWEIPSALMWQSDAGQDRLVFDLLRGAANLTSWCLNRILIGAPWDRLRYGHLLSSILDQSLIIRDPNEQAVSMAQWLRL